MEFGQQTILISYFFCCFPFHSFITFLSLSLFPSNTSLLVNSVFHLQPSHDYSGPDDDAVACPSRTIQPLLASWTHTRVKNVNIQHTRTVCGQKHFYTRSLSQILLTSPRLNTQQVTHRHNWHDTELPTHTPNNTSTYTSMHIHTTGIKYNKMRCEWLILLELSLILGFSWSNRSRK